MRYKLVVSRTAELQNITETDRLQKKNACPAVSLCAASFLGCFALHLVLLQQGQCVPLLNTTQLLLFCTFQLQGIPDLEWRESKNKSISHDYRGMSMMWDKPPAWEHWHTASPMMYQGFLL